MSFGIPFDVLFSCLSHGRRTQKLPIKTSVAVGLCDEITFDTDFQFAMGVHKPLTPGEVPSFRGGEGFALSVASAPALPKGEPYEMFISGTKLQFAMNVIPPRKVCSFHPSAVVPRWLLRMRKNTCRGADCTEHCFCTSVKLKACDSFRTFLFAQKSTSSSEKP